MSIASRIEVRPLAATDLGAIDRLDARITGRIAEGGEAVRVAERCLERDGSVALVATAGGLLEGYLLGEVRAFEFGSEPCGWIFAVGVDPQHAREGVGSALLERAELEFLRRGVGTVRTMVRRNDVPILAFFRRHRFVGGPFVQLERELDRTLPPLGDDEEDPADA